jgi:hypothetical protein
MRRTRTFTSPHDHHAALLAQQGAASQLASRNREAAGLLKSIYEQLKRWGNCPFCMADDKKVSPGAKPDQKRRHGHPKSCLWLKIEALVRKEKRCR